MLCSSVYPDDPSAIEYSQKIQSSKFRGPYWNGKTYIVQLLLPDCSKVTFSWWPFSPQCSELSFKFTKCRDGFYFLASSPDMIYCYDESSKKYMHLYHINKKGNFYK